MSSSGTSTAEITILMNLMFVTKYSVQYNCKNVFWENPQT